MAQDLFAPNAIRTITPRQATTYPSPPLITPFVQPSECTTIRDLIPSVVIIPQNGTESARSETIWTVSSGPANPNYSSCQPPGFSSRNSATFFAGDLLNIRYYVDRPALCPQSWSTLDLSIYRGSPTEILTCAKCCLSGHQITTSRGASFTTTGPGYTQMVTSVWIACASNITALATVTGTLAAGQITTAIFSSGVFMYPALSIEWVAADTVSMSPRPVFTDAPTSPADYGRKRLTWNLALFLAVGIPGLCLLSAIVLVVILWRLRKMKQKKHLKAARIAHELELRDMSGSGRGNGSNSAPEIQGGSPVVR